MSDERVMCSHCGGSGEGQWEGYSCNICGGLGTVPADEDWDDGSDMAYEEYRDHMDDMGDN